MTPIQSALPPRTGWLSDLIILNERIRRDRIITLTRSDYHEVPPAHVVDAVQRRAAK